MRQSERSRVPGMSDKICGRMTGWWLRLQERAGRMLLVAVPRHGHDRARIEHGPIGLAFQPDQAVPGAAPPRSADLDYRPCLAARALLSRASGGVVQPRHGGLPSK